MCNRMDDHFHQCLEELEEQSTEIKGEAAKDSRDYELLSDLTKRPCGLERCVNEAGKVDLPLRELHDLAPIARLS